MSYNTQENLTDEEKRDLQKQLDQAQNETEHWRRECLKWEQMYEQMLLSDKNLASETAPDEAIKGNKETVSYNKFDRLRKKYTDVIEKMVYMKEKSEKERKSLIDKITEQHEEVMELRRWIDDEVGPPRGLRSPSPSGNLVQELSTEEMDPETALEEVKSLRKHLCMKDEHIKNLELQIRSFPEVALKTPLVRTHSRDNMQRRTKVKNCLLVNYFLEVSYCNYMSDREMPRNCDAFVLLHRKRQ